MNVHVIRIAAALILGSSMTAAIGQTDTPMMVKQEAGQPITESVPRDLCAPDGVAIGGYDLVSYRAESGPLPGSDEFSATHDGRQYWFVNDVNRRVFLADPKRFIPAYDGFCAITLALGKITCPEYTNFKIEEDRLLLFEVTGFTNGRTLWNSDPDNFRGKADSNYRQLIE